MLTVLGSLNFAVLAAASQLVETAIAAAIYQTWPLFVVYGMARGLKRNAQERSSSSSSGSAVLEHVSLAAIATVGVLFMLLSQNEPSESSFATVPTIQAAAGILIALLAALCISANVIGSLQLGRVVYDWYVIRPEYVHRPLEYTLQNAGDRNFWILMWLTLFATTIARIASIPIQIVLAIVTDGISPLSTSALLGALVNGLAGVASICLIRISNILAEKRPGINAIAYLSPVLALAILAISGISLPRFDLFLIGAILILAINVLIQMKPDQEADASKYGKDPRSGTRLGFTVLIVSLWTFGTVLYLRDELLPAHWLELPTGDYWTLIALSATVFTLILGFRSSRLSERMRTEDGLMLDLFRTSETLTAERLLSRRFLKQLSHLDTSSPNRLAGIYESLCRSIRVARRRDVVREHQEAIVAVQTKLDMLMHSKQQGRDIVELLSLTSFAFVTIGLGLLARQAVLGATGGTAWSGFLSEVFMLLFASTVAFLLMNLFDLRREREAPLIVAMRDKHDKETGEFGVFFRYKERLPVHLIGAILISVTMAGLFIGLFYDKWLG